MQYSPVCSSTVGAVLTFTRIILILHDKFFDISYLFVNTVSGLRKGSSSISDDH